MSCKSQSCELMQSYYLYSAILALKLLALKPLAAIVCHPEKVQRANISDLKNLTPFWLVAGLYMTTSPDQVTALTLLRVFVVARLIAAVGYITRIPTMLKEAMQDITISLDQPLTQTYIVHAALLAVKLLALSPLAALTWVNKGIFPNTDIVRRAYLSELKNLAPFWIVGALYLTTNPPVILGTTLFRIYTIARICVILGYATKPLPALISDLALITSYFINFYMSLCVIYRYKDHLYN